MSTRTIDYDALARQAGAVNVPPSTSQATAPPSAPPKAGTGAVDYDALARQAGAVDVQPLPTETPGQITNDVGNTVIVPTDGENFADTMRRAAAQGQKTTPDQIKKEVATMPGKAETVLAAAPAIGAAGGAGLAGMGEMMLHSPAVAKAVLQHVSEPGVVLKFPYGRAVEYVLTGKLGLSQSHLSDIAKHIP